MSGASRPARVVVVGAGISGLVTAHRLRRAGAEVTVVEARERIGGRIVPLPTEEGLVLEGGGEFVAPFYRATLALMAEFGISRRPSNADVHGGRSVRLVGGRRLVETTPFEGTPGMAAEFDRVVGVLDALAATVPEGGAWEHPDAEALDRATLREWLIATTGSDAVRAEIEGGFELCGLDASGWSLLGALHVLRGFGGYGRYSLGVEDGVEGGLSGLVARLADGLSGRILLGDAVTAVAQDDDGVRVSLASGRVLAADTAVLALSPRLAQRIGFEPPLPPGRARLHRQWSGGGEVKAFAVYDRPWWREQGLSGSASGHPVFSYVLDLSPADGGLGVLGSFNGQETGSRLASHADAFLSAESAKGLYLDALAEYFGERAREALNVYATAWSWQTDPWHPGAASAFAPGMLSTVGSWLPRAHGRVLFAGAEAGRPVNDFVEGAVLAGEEAARAALGEA